MKLGCCVAGYLRSHSRWAATPKVTVAATVGYFSGKFSYQSKCAKMLMGLPNSQLGEALCQKKLKGGFQEACQCNCLAIAQFLHR